MIQKKSSVSIGRTYELLVLAVLRRYSFQLVHSGRPGDGGIDLIGHWTLPNTRTNVVGQCKHHESPLGPKNVREFESTFQRMNQTRQTTGVLVSYSGFSKQAMQIALNSSQPLICSQIRPSSSANHLLITTSENNTSSSTNEHNNNNIRPSSHERYSCNVNTTMINGRVDARSQQRKKSLQTSTTGLKLTDKGLPLSQLGFSLWGNEERKVKCLCKSGYYFRSLPSQLVDGSIRAFLMNHTMSSLNPCVSIMWRCGVEKSSIGRSILILFRCPVSGSMYDLGAVSRRHSGSGEPTAWHYHNTDTTSQ